MYRPLPLHHADNANLDRDKHAKKAWGSLWYYLGGLAFLSLVSVAILYRVETATIPTDCGTSVAEARAKGCQYEPMQRAWIPQQCYFPEPATEYDPFNDRTWFLDATLETQADVRELKSGDVPVAYVANFHQEHCTYNWRKLAIAVNKKARWIDNRVGNIHHATHCSLGLAEQTRNMSDCGVVKGGTYTKSNINFLKCQRLS